MTTAITLRVLTGEGVALEDQAVSIVAPGEPGYLGILRDHAPLVTTLKPGRLTWRRPSGEFLAAGIGAGLLEVANNRVTILTDSLTEAEPAHAEAPL